jgi:hypothetical protein
LNIVSLILKEKQDGYLKKEKEIPENVNIHDDVEDKKDIGIDFVEGGEDSDEDEEVAKPEINFDDI